MPTTVGCGEGGAPPQRGGGEPLCARTALHARPSAEQADSLVHAQLRGAQYSQWSHAGAPTSGCSSYETSIPRRRRSRGASPRGQTLRRLSAGTTVAGARSGRWSGHLRHRPRRTEGIAKPFAPLPRHRQTRHRTFQAVDELCLALGAGPVVHRAPVSVTTRQEIHE